MITYGTMIATESYTTHTDAWIMYTNYETNARVIQRIKKKGFKSFSFRFCGDILEHSSMNLHV